MGNLQPAPDPAVAIVNEERRATAIFNGWMLAISRIFSSGFTGTVPLAKLTGGGANGSLTFDKGVLVSRVDPT